MRTPLHADGLARRVYPFLGLAIVGLVSLRGLAVVAGQPPLLAAAAIGVLLVLGPLASFSLPRVGKPATAVPVLAGFGLALYPLGASGPLVATTLSAALAPPPRGTTLLPGRA